MEFIKPWKWDALNNKKSIQWGRRLNISNIFQHFRSSVSRGPHSSSSVDSMNLHSLTCRCCSTLRWRYREPETKRGETYYLSNTRLFIFPHYCAQLPCVVSVILKLQIFFFLFLFSNDDIQNCVIYLCATMWHETYDEMLKILISMFRFEILLLLRIDSVFPVKQS